MGEFFRGWKRKAGVVALFLACMMTAAWIRSQTVTDIIHWNHGTRFGSIDSRFVLVYSTIGEPLKFPKWETIPRSNFEKNIDSNAMWYRRFAGSGIAEVSGVSVIFAHDLVAVLPLIVLSALLLLGKSGKTRASDDHVTNGKTGQKFICENESARV